MPAVDGAGSSFALYEIVTVLGFNLVAAEIAAYGVLDNHVGSFQNTLNMSVRLFYYTLHWKSIFGFIADVLEKSRCPYSGRRGDSCYCSSP